MDFTVCYSITFLTNNQWVVLVLIAVNVCSGSCGVIMAYYLDSLLVIATAEGIERPVSYTHLMLPTRIRV